MNRLLLLALCALFAADAGARTLYVDARRPNNNGNGLSKAKAKKTIQAAINASKKGDTILVYSGTYAPIKTKNKKVTIKSLKGSGETFIQAAADGRILADMGIWEKNPKAFSRSDKKYFSSYHQLKGGSATVLVGFTFRPKPTKSGYTTDDWDPPSWYKFDQDWVYGLWGVSALTGGTVKKCKIDHCGDAMISFSYSRSAPQVKSYYANSFPTIWKTKLTGCTIVACKGGRIQTVKQGNKNILTPESGLAICSSTLRRCKIVGNESAGTTDDPPNPFCVHDSEFYNCLVAENDRMMTDNSVFSNCTLAKNSNFTMTKSNVQSCIVYGCGKSLFKSSKKNKFSATFKDGRNPMFVDYAGGEFHLSASSPCINRGKKVFGTGTVDLDGKKRVRGKIDRGCYEYYNKQPLSVVFMKGQDNQIDSVLARKQYISPKSYGSLPTPTKTGYVFAGWWTDPIAGNQVFQSSPVTTYRLYAHWIQLGIQSINALERTGDVTLNPVFIYHPKEQVWGTQTVNNFPLVIPPKLHGATITGICLSSPSPWSHDALRIILSKITSVTIQNPLMIKTFSLNGCSSLKSISIPKSVNFIAFEGCTSLKFISIPNSVNSINFRGCSALTSISIPSSVNSISFGGCSALATLTIPDSVTSIEDSAFYGCSGLTSISIPHSVTNIGNHAFRGCSALTSISIPNNVTRIGRMVFTGCSSLREITIPNSVTSIGYNAFQDCTSLTNVTIPKSITTSEYRLFDNCPKLKTIRLQNGSPLVPGDDFSVPDGCTVVRY